MTGALGPALVASAVLFNAALCFVNTRGWATIGTAPVAAVSLLITGAALAAMRGRIGLGLASVAASVLGIAAGLKLLNEALDLKILFDLLVPPAFFLLGTATPRPGVHRLLAALMAIVIGTGLFELLAPDAFQAVFNILDFYQNKGAVAADAVNYGGTAFFGSAQRSEEAGRTLLPFLFGQHRVSSVFLEPISMGNFPIICLCWLLATWRGPTGGNLLLAAAIAFCVVLPDSRQATATCILLVALRLSPARASPLFAALLPPLVLAGLAVVGTSALAPGEAPAFTSDDFAGRLLFSAKVLGEWGPAEWLALAPSPTYTADTGYAYLVNNLSLPVACFLWFLAFAPRRGARRAREARLMRAGTALYVATSLCVGASLVSIKTAALLWFLLGSTEGES